MKVLLWLRALKARNFFNWNGKNQPQIKDYGYALILEDLNKLDNFHVAGCFQITSVNRTTGRITMVVA